MASLKKLTNLVLVLISDMIKINQKFILVSILMAMGIAETYPAPPDIPEIQAMYNHEKITITWNKKAEGSIDPLTGYSDFEGYRIYKSTDGGVTWGKSWNRIYDHEGNQVGWKPFEKYDLNEYSDSLHCIYKNAYYDSAEGELCLSAGISGWKSVVSSKIVCFRLDDYMMQY